MHVIFIPILIFFWHEISEKYQLLLNKPILLVTLQYKMFKYTTEYLRSTINTYIHKHTVSLPACGFYNLYSDNQEEKTSSQETILDLTFPLIYPLYSHYQEVIFYL